VPLPSKPYAVVVGVDHSEPSRGALFEALLIVCERPEAELHVVHVETIVQVMTFGGQPPGTLADPPLGPAFQRLQAFARHELAQFNHRQRKREAKPFTRLTVHVRRDAPAEEIAQLAVDLDADLVVVGARGATTVQRLTLGSVAHAVLALALCPVLLVRSKQSADSVSTIQPPCPRCVEVRLTSLGCELWCDQHRAQHGQRRSYEPSDRIHRTTSSVFRN
jgi:nucleotide-binding universal stress UspA family protein